MTLSASNGSIDLEPVGLECVGNGSDSPDSDEPSIRSVVVSKIISAGTIQPEDRNTTSPKIRFVVNLELTLLCQLTLLLQIL